MKLYMELNLRGITIMNKLRRKAIRNVIRKLNEILEGKNKISIEVFEDFIDEIQTILDEEETYFYNIPENLQNGARYEESENAIDKLEDAISDLEYIDVDCSKEETEKYILSAVNNLNNCV